MSRRRRPGPHAGPASETAPPGHRSGVRTVYEVSRDAAVPLYGHPDWIDRFPWLVQGTTGRGADDAPFDLGLFGAAPSGTVQRRWRELRAAAGADRVVHARQVHGAEVATHSADGPGGLHVLEGCDGHVTDQPGVLLSVSIADCVPVSLVIPDRRAVAMLHGGWRGVSEDILRAGVQALAARTGASPESLHMHLGPAICGECYEVGPEVHEALGLDPAPAPEPVDLRAILARRGSELGIPPDQISRSAFCTRCGGPDGARPFFSHRAGEAQRQMAILGIRNSVPQRPAP